MKKWHKHSQLKWQLNRKKRSTDRVDFNKRIEEREILIKTDKEHSFFIHDSQEFILMS